MNAGFLFFLSLLGWALVLMLLLPRLKMGAGLLCALCGMRFAAYAGGIVAGAFAPAAMPVTAYGLLWGGLAALALGLLGAALDRRGLRKRLLTPGLAAYLAFAAAAVFLLRGAVIEDHDSFSYWMRIVRELFTYQRFPIHADTTMAHTDYFPLLAALQYCVVRVFGWQDASLLYVTCACVLCSVAAIADLLPKKGWGALAAVVLVYAYAAFGSPLFSTRADGPISALFAAGAVSLFLRESDEPTAWLPAFAAAAVLTGLKIYTGLLLALTLCVAMLCSMRTVPDKGLARRLRLLAFGALALCLTLQLTWSGLYHYETRLAHYEAAVAAAPFTGAAAEGAAPAFALRDLFTGNPRTEQLASVVNGDSLQAVGALIGDSFAAYAQSALPWLWLFLLAAIPPIILMDRESRKRALWLLGTLLIAAVLYLLGLFASYFVQAETAGAAVTYMVTVTTPLMIALVFLLLRAAQGGRAKLAGLVALPLALAGMLFLLPPARLAEQCAFDASLTGYAALADGYFQNEISDQLTPTDGKKHALLIDCSYEASEIKSESGIVHAYQYYGMPLRVHILLYPYGNYDLLDAVESGALTDLLAQNRCTLLLLRVEDELYWESIRDALSLDGDWDEPIAVYDVTWEDGQPAFRCRLDEGESDESEATEEP